MIRKCGFMLTVGCHDRMVEKQAGGSSADCALLVGRTTCSAIAAAVPAGWQILEVTAGPAAVDSAADGKQSVGNRCIRQPVASLHAVLQAIVSSHFSGRVIPESIGSVRDEAGGAAQLVVGHVMKLSRESALAQRGMLPLLPADGVCFLPLRLDVPLASQGPFHVVLHKVLPASPRARSRPSYRMLAGAKSLRAT
jgi:hypothetical protein